MSSDINSVERIRHVAQREIRKHGIDAAVREIAKNGQYDGTTNWWNDWYGLSFHCTGPSLDSAKVVARVYDDAPSFTLYDVSDYGRYVVTFRRGPWVKAVCDYASQLREERIKREFEAARQAARQSEDEELKHFAPFETWPLAAQS